MVKNTCTKGVSQRRQTPRSIHASKPRAPPIRVSSQPFMLPCERALSGRSEGAVVACLLASFPLPWLPLLSSKHSP